MNKEKIHIRSSAYGIGDAICGAYVAAGARREYPEMVVTYYTRHVGWIQPFISGFIVKPLEAYLPFRHDKNVGDVWKNYRGELACSGGMTRKAWLASQILVDGVEVTPAVPTISSNKFAPIRGDRYIVLAPYASYITRMCDLGKFTELAFAIQKEFGIGVVVIGNTMWRDHASNMGVDAYIDTSPYELARLLKNAELTITIDSGIAHFCGLIDANCLSIVSIFEPSMLYSHTSVRTLSPNKEVKCTFCYFQKSRGYDETVCPTNCMAINTIQVEDVLDAVDEDLQDYHFLESEVGIENWN